MPEFLFVPLRFFLRLLRKQEKFLSALSCSAMRFTGRYPEAIHPKHLYSPEAPWYLKHAPKSGIFLDVGCGSGSACLAAALAGAAGIVGIDYNARNLSLCGRRLAESGYRGHAQFLELNLEKAEFPLSDESVDLVLFSNVIEHLHNRVAVLREISRVLRPSGVLLLSAPNGNTSWKRMLRWAGLFYFDDSDHKIEYDRDSLTAEFTAAGFEAVEPWQVVTLSTPLAGAIDFSAVFSPALYRMLIRWKIAAAAARPENSIGWRLILRKSKKQDAYVG